MRSKKREKALKKINKCALCNYTSMEKYRMSRHMRTHTGEKPYMCGMCDQCFAQKCSLKEHLWKHITLRSCSKCPFCAAIFVSESEVKSHVDAMHSPIEPILCPKCPINFTDQYSMDEHQKTHDTMFRYQCLECAFCTGERKKMIWHMGVHNVWKPLQCSNCKQYAKSKQEMHRHLLEAHGITICQPPVLDNPSQPSPTEDAQDKTELQMELEQQYQVMDEQGNMLQLSEADAAVIHSAMQQSDAGGTLQIAQGEEGTITVTILTHGQDAAIQNIEENVGVLAGTEALEHQLIATRESLIPEDPAKEQACAEEYTTEVYRPEEQTSNIEYAIS